MKPLAIDIKLTGNYPGEDLCGKCRDNSLCNDTSSLNCDVMNAETWKKVVEFMERIDYSAEIGIFGNIEKDPYFFSRWNDIKKFCSIKNPAWININWKYITDDMINICGDDLRLIVRFGPCTFNDIHFDPGLLDLLRVINSRKKKYILNVRLIEKEKTIDEILSSFTGAREGIYNKLKDAGLENALVLSQQIDFDLCMSDETDKAFNRFATLYLSKEEIPLAKWYGYTDPVYEKISTEICSSPMLLTAINWNGDISRCCMDYNFKKAEGNILTMNPEDLFKGAEYCSYPVRCFDERPL